MARSNLVVNLNKIRAANRASTPEASVCVFDYFAPQSAKRQNDQRPLVRVIKDSLTRTQDNEWIFRGVNLYRVDENSQKISEAIRTYRLNRINGLVRQP